MKLPSISYLSHQVTKTFSRFPLVVTDAIIGTFSAIYMVEMEKYNIFPAVKLLLACMLGLTLFLSVSLIKEKRKFSRNSELIVNSIVVIILAVYYFTLPDKINLDHDTGSLIRFGLFSVGLHLLVSFAPFFDKNEINGFWEYNKTLFLRILTAILYSSVLYTGLSVALLSIDKLLDIEVSIKIYSYLAIFIAGIFNTCFFLAGIPENFSELENKYYFPKGLQVFTQYILIPLVTIYLIILYLYGLKIGIKLDWPKGGVSALIIGCSFLGILSLLLIYPLQNSDDKKLFKLFSNSFYLLLLPLIVMLFFAVSRRVSDYGITENRYFLYIISFWLFGISLYFIFNKAKNIIIIPISLFIIVFLISFGPWGVFSISQKSQLNRLIVLLEKNNILQNGHIVKAKNKLSIEDNNQINFVVNYLDERNYLDSVDQWFIPKIKLDDFNNQKNIVEAMGLKYVPYWNIQVNPSEEHFYFYGHNSSNFVYDIKNYNFMYKMSFYSSEPNGIKLKTNDGTYIIKYNQQTSTIKIIFPNDQLDINLSNLVQNIDNKYSENPNELPSEKMILVKESAKYKVKIYFTSLQGTKAAKIEVSSIIGDLLIQKK